VRRAGFPGGGAKKLLHGHVSRNSQIPALDGVRGIAILLVLTHNLSPFDGSSGAAARLATILLNPGWIGVQLFFVLSGFLITGVLLDSRGAPSYYTSFIGRRVLRIFPVYYATLLVMFVVLPVFHAQPPELTRDAHSQVFLWTYLVNWFWFFGHEIAGFSHCWSLAVEEQFYLAWPFVVRACGPTRIVKLAVWMSLVAFASRVTIRLLGAEANLAYVFTICRMDALALGGAVAATARTNSALFERHRYRLLAICLGVLVAGFFATHGYGRLGIVSQTVGYTALAVAFSALIAAVVGDHAKGGGPISRVLANPVLRAFGKYSYGMYMFHPLLNDFVGVPLLERHGLMPPTFAVGFAYVVGSIAVTFALAYVSYVGFEQHFLRLKRHFEAFRGSANAVASTSAPAAQLGVDTKQ
jgi:peptidoglycan/LPS O-acetylase OafA/YrhL